MIYLLSSIVCATALFLIFKLFEKNKVNNASAIAVNYLAASVIGFSFTPLEKIKEIPYQDWIFPAAITGALFLFLFRLIAVTSQKIGISATTVAHKMGVVIPVTAAVFLYNDTMTFPKVAGILLALAGVYLSSRKEISIQVEKKYLFFPAILFAGSGFSDTLIKYTEHFYLNEESMLLFIPCLFGFSALTGIFSLAAGRNFHFSGKDILWGIILGIPNYGSIYFLMKALKEMPSSIIFPINNMGIVAASSIAAFFLFKENLSKINWIGIIISLAAILLIAIS